jgi:hypothetical protein
MTVLFTLTVPDAIMSSDFLREATPQRARKTESLTVSVVVMSRSDADQGFRTDQLYY